MIAHEQSHLEAHDVRIFTGALALLVAMPWNLPLWWQLRRLRFAIEVDCDARVLQSGRDARIYGETLITVGQRQSGYLGAVAGMSEPRAFSEKETQHHDAEAGTWMALVDGRVGMRASLALVATAAQIEPPNAAMSLATPQAGEEMAAPIQNEATRISFDARSMDVDNSTHAMRFDHIILSAGNVIVKADRGLATPGDFKNSRWTFDGNVRIDAGTARDSCVPMRPWSSSRTIS